MDLLIRQATLIAPGHPSHRKSLDILIHNGIIEALGQNLEANGAEVIEGENLHVSQGWFDCHVNFRDPGFEHKEDLISGCEAAAKGGFTSVACMPNTFPVIDNKSGVQYLINKSKGSVVDILPVGALSKGLEGKEISEMFDMKMAGAIAFGDDCNPVRDAGLLKRALLYVKGFDGRILHFAHDKDLGNHGKMNEGPVSTRLGLKGIPALAEEITIARDLALLEYTSSRLHFSTVSTVRGVELIREAKEKGLQVTADVAAHQLVLDDSSLETFDTNLKVMPPLRDETNIAGLLAGLQDGTIDAICSDHRPEDEENKKLEFDQAAFGISGIETTFAILNTNLEESLGLDLLIEKLTSGPRQALGLEAGGISKGQAANLTLFDPTASWNYQGAEIKSKARNTPFIGKDLKGKVIGVVNNGQYAAN